MQRLFSPRFKYTTWRRLWLALAKTQRAMGLPIPPEAITALEANLDTVDLALAAKYEKELKHDVMAHIHALGEQAPEAKGILHMGATSTFVTDNTDLIQMHEALKLLKGKLVHLLEHMALLAKSTRSLATLSYTHFQPAQPTTVGKRLCLWIQDLALDLQDLLEKENTFQFLGLKGATGTQASFLDLFDGDANKVLELERLLAIEMGFPKLFTISSQTYTRKQDMRLFSTLEGLAASAHKCATDLRLLAHLGEMQEAFGDKQVGSSAMPHKRNPIYAERICGLSRFLITLSQNGTLTLATQWLERSLDDSANRRLVIPEAFLTADELLNLLIHLFTHLHIDHEAITQNLNEKLPLIAKESILMQAVKKGKDRQIVHERLRLVEDLDAIARDPEIGLTREELTSATTPNTGRSSAQVTHFLEKELAPLLKDLPSLAPTEEQEI